MLLSHIHLLDLIAAGIITADPANVNAASIDLTLGDIVLLEDPPKWDKVINLGQKETLPLREVRMGADGYTLRPGEFILAQSREVFNLPPDISAEYKLKSSQARSGLDHANAGWADAGWNGSVLTLEFKNQTRWHELTITPGMKCGQMVFFRHDPVPMHASYAAKGQYNGDKTATASKGVR